MAGGGFFGGLAEGFSSTYGARQKQASLNEQLGLDKEKLQLQQDQFTEQKSEFNKDIDLRTRALDLQTVQEQRLKEHQEFQQKLDKATQDLSLKQHDFEVTKNLLATLDTTATPGLRKAKAVLFAQSMGIDEKSPNFKAIQDVLANMPEDQLQNARDLITEFLPNAKPGAITAFAEGVMKDPSAFLGLLTEVAKPPAAKNPIAVADPTSSTGERFVSAEDAVNRESPGGAQRKTLAEIKAEADLKGISDIDLKYAQNTLTAADAAKSMAPFVQQFELAMQSGNFKPGTFGGLREITARGLEFFGIDVDKMFPKLKGAVGDAATAEAMEAASARLGLEFADKMSRLTNLSLSYIQDAMPSLGRTEGGNQVILDMMKRAADRGRQVENLYATYSEKSSLSPPGMKSFRQAVSDLDRTDPMIPKELEDRIRAGGKAGAAVPIADLATDAARVVAPSANAAAGAVTDAATGAAGAVAGAVGAAGRFFTAPSGTKLPISKTVTGTSYVLTTRGELPLAQSPGDIQKLAPGTDFVYSDGVIYHKE